MTVKNIKRCKCILPWTSLILGATGDYRPCCAISPIPLDKMPRSKNDLLQIFNSPYMVELRKKIVSNELSGIPCDLCEEKFIYDEKLDKHNPLPEDNYVKHLMYESFYNDHAYLNYIPASIMFQTSKACNINCIMCNQKPLQKIDMELLDIDAISSLFENLSFKTIGRIGLWGGEPLFSKDGLQILRLLTAREDLDNTTVSLITNGTLIEEHLALFDTLKNWRISISLDAVGELFEKVRRGANFDKVERGIKAIARRANGMTKKLDIISIIMKSTLGRTDQLIDYVESIDISPDVIYFQVIHGNNDENFFNNPGSIENIDWDTRLQKTIERLHNSGCEQAEFSLSLVRQQMLRGLKKSAPVLYSTEQGQRIAAVVQTFTTLIDETNQHLSQGVLATADVIVESWKLFFMRLIEASQDSFHAELWSDVLRCAGNLGIADHLFEVFSRGNLSDDVKALRTKFYSSQNVTIQ